jgi:hypothetical protein
MLPVLAASADISAKIVVPKLSSRPARSKRVMAASVWAVRPAGNFSPCPHGYSSVIM